MAFKKLLAFSIIAALPLAVLAAASGEKVKQVEAKYTCFVNKKHFDKPQTEIIVNGRKYYGCCESCVTQLMQDPTTRVAIDPVSGKEVDKAEAVIGIDKAGNVYFFQSADNLNKFRVPAGG
jgi:YHS domain-containing protein